MNAPRYSLSPFRKYEIEHYYGDYVRQLFVASAVLSILAIPTIGSLLPFSVVVQVASAIVLVLLAGITSPHSKQVLWYDAVVSGIGIFLMEAAAFYLDGSFLLFLVRETVAVMLLFALYYSVKTLRAMIDGTIGEVPELGELDEVKAQTKREEQQMP